MSDKENGVTQVGDVGLPEDLARADLYGLIARFFHFLPDQELLDQIAATADQQDPSNEAPLAKAWINVVEVAKITLLKLGRRSSMQTLLALASRM